MRKRRPKRKRLQDPKLCSTWVEMILSELIL
jgi:hypothetical protein